MMVVLAHQGASGHAPSNTLESFRLAMAMHADILETDVHLTRDGVIVTMRRLIDLGADGIITDYPDRAVNVLREMGRK